MAEVRLWVPDSYAPVQKAAAPAATDAPPPESETPVPRGFIGSGVRAAGWNRLLADQATMGSPRVTREELIGLWRTEAWVRAGISRIAKVAIQEGWEIVPCPEELEEGEEADPEGKGYLERFFNPDVAGQVVNIRQWEQTASKLFLTFVHLKLFSECSWELVKNGLGEDVDFAPIYGRVVPNIDRRGNFVNPKEAYRQVLGRDEVLFAQDEVLRFGLPDVDGRLGVSDLEAIELAASTDLWAQVWNRATFKNNRTPPSAYIFEDTARDADMKAFSTYMDEFYAGAENANKSPTVRGLKEVRVLGGAFGKDAEFLRGREFNRDEMYSIIGVSAGVMGQVRDVSRANLEGLIQIVYRMEAKPLQEIVEQTVNGWRRWGLEIRGWKFHFRSPDFEDRASEAETSVRLVGSSLSSPNEERAKMGKRPYPGGDVFYMPQNMVAVGEPQEEDRLASPPEPPAQEAPAAPAAAQPKEASDEQIVAELRRWKKLSARLAREGRPQRIFDTVVVPEPLRRTLQMAVMTASEVGQIELIFDEVIDALGAVRVEERDDIEHWPGWQNELLDQRQRELDELERERREAAARELAGGATE